MGARCWRGCGEEESAAPSGGCTQCGAVLARVPQARVRGTHHPAQAARPHTGVPCGLPQPADAGREGGHAGCGGLGGGARIVAGGHDREGGGGRGPWNCVGARHAGSVLRHTARQVRHTAERPQLQRPQRPRALPPLRPNLCAALHPSRAGGGQAAPQEHVRLHRGGVGAPRAERQLLLLQPPVRQPGRRGAVGARHARQARQ
mmetsp:Transcript_45737/g.115114  ORF Transcript_45737/g.115114 Transcript_45737/m.115114 type:complete len:203 (+) Transcript_45737:448-1056(+)